jgi:hypothetical protein
MNLTEHFTKEEMIYSDTAKANNLNNEPNEVELKTLKHTCQYFFEPLRTLLNKEYKTYKEKTVKNVGIKITSGFRGSALNTKIGGAKNSQHCKGEAGDFEVIIYLTDGTKAVLPYTETYAFVKKKVRAKELSVDQLICEASNGAYWVHGSYKAAGATVNRNQFMLYKGGKYTLDTN